MLIRFLDIAISAAGLLISFPLMLAITMFGFMDTGSPVFCQQRVGRNRKPFILFKFRTMKLDTASVATHLASRSAITPLGHLLRSSKLDELPQLWNVFIGDMSIVGPRPCLYSQAELIHERDVRDVFSVRPGITGLAQINSIDMSEPEKLAILDSEMIEQMSLRFYLLLIVKTMLGFGLGDRVAK